MYLLLPPQPAQTPPDADSLSSMSMSSSSLKLRAFSIVATISSLFIFKLRLPVPSPLSPPRMNSSAFLVAASSSIGFPGKNHHCSETSWPDLEPPDLLNWTGVKKLEITLLRDKAGFFFLPPIEEEVVLVSTSSPDKQNPEMAQSSVTCVIGVVVVSCRDVIM